MAIITTRSQNPKSNNKRKKFSPGRTQVIKVFGPKVAGWRGKFWVFGRFWRNSNSATTSLVLNLTLDKKTLIVSFLPL